MTEEIVSYGVLSLIPAILAVVLAFWTKNVIISLMASLFVGCLITAGWNPWNAMQVMFSDHLFVDMTGSSNAQTIIMMSFVGGFVALIEATGGAKAFAAAIANKVHRRSTAQTTAWLGGLAIFFSDSGNSLILGPIFRPIFDRLPSWPTFWTPPPPRCASWSPLPAGACTSWASSPRSLKIWASRPAMPVPLYRPSPTSSMLFWRWCWSPSSH